MRRDFFGDPAAFASYAALMGEAFDLDVARRDALAGHDLAWTPLARFDDDGTCIASLETAALEFRLDGIATAIVGLRSIAVTEAWRGRGLFRSLMESVLTDRTGPILLYTSEPALYTRFGFVPVPQHAFSGPCPLPGPRLPSRRLSLAKPEDRALLRAAFATRAPVSAQCAMMGAASLFLTAVEEESLSLLHCPEIETIVAYEIDENTLTLVDVVTPATPAIETLLGALPEVRDTLTVLFPPDRFGCALEARPEDNGLMSLGALPPAMQRPFMLPPTTEF